MANKKIRTLTGTAMQPSSLILRECARMTAEHDRIAGAYRDLTARLDLEIFKGRGKTS